MHVVELQLSERLFCLGERKQEQAMVLFAVLSSFTILSEGGRGG